MAKKLLDIFVSVVCVYDENVTDIERQVIDLSKMLKTHYANYEILIIDNGIYHNEFSNVQKLLNTIPCIRIVKLSKISETDTAIFAGLEAAIGDYVCIRYNNDPIDKVIEIVTELKSSSDIVFGVATNLRRQNFIEDLGARLFYWYNRRFLKINIPHGATYFIGLNRSAVNALTRSSRYTRHIRYLSKQIGFRTVNYNYRLPKGKEVYSTSKKALVLRAINLISSYSSHPLRAITYFGIFAGILNLIYAFYVVAIRLSSDNVEAGWTTTSLQTSLMFFILFIILAMLAEYIGQILEEVRKEPSYHVINEFTSTVSIADETRRNVTK